MSIRPNRQQSGLRGWKPALLSTLFLLLGLVACQNEPMPTPYPDSGYGILPEFAPLYEAAGGASVLGEPITGTCTTGDGRIAQYTQRLRFERTPGQNEVTAYPLGEWALAGVAGTAPAPVPADSEKRTFPNSPYTVQDQFLTFYEAHRGEIVLGPPISPQLDEGELRVQYFRNGRLEWHPNAPRAFRVRLGPLGQAHYLTEGRRSMNCDPLLRPVQIQATLDAQVESAVQAPILYTGEEQVLYVKVTTQDQRPVTDVSVLLTVSYLDERFVQRLGRTDNEGNAAGNLELPLLEPGNEVVVEVSVLGSGTQVLGRRALSFTTWW